MGKYSQKFQLNICSLWKLLRT